MFETSLPPFDGTDPVFVSYRHTDGTTITEELAWLLRSAGLPVWRDVDDLPPGDTPTRLREALADGLSAAVLVITRDVAQSVIIKKTESPVLIRLHQDLDRFALGIANNIRTSSGSLDYGAPDRVLDNLTGTLSGVDQHSTDRTALLHIVQGILWKRIANQRGPIAARDKVFTLSIQTRNTPQVYDRTGATLDIRLRRSLHPRLPSADGMKDLMDTIALLPDAVTRSAARTVRISGGAHLSVALALGAALPSTRIGFVEIEDQKGQLWSSELQASSTHDFLRLHAEEASLEATPELKHVAIFVDLLPQPSDEAFARFLDEHSDVMSAWRHYRSTEQSLLDPADAGAIAAQVAARIKELSNSTGNSRVHVLLRTPFPIAVLIGRLTNTLRVRAYEWDDSNVDKGPDFRARYVPALEIMASNPSGAIAEVLLPSDATAGPARDKRNRRGPRDFLAQLMRRRVSNGS